MSLIFWQPDTLSTAHPSFALKAAYLELKQGTLYRRYVQFNPVESAGIDNYWNGGERPPDARTPTGRALLGWADIYRGHQYG